MLAGVLAHIDELGGLLHRPKRCFDYSLRRPHQGDHGSIGSLSGVDVQKLDLADGFYPIGYLLDN